MSMKKDPIWAYYDRELRQFRLHAQEFATRYKIEAAALGLGVDRATDPHVERMIESFALLTARVRAKLDDDFPELIDGMLGVLYPHLLAPIPSMGIIQFDPITGAAKVPQRFGNGFLFWTANTLYRSDAFDTKLTPIAPCSIFSARMREGPPSDTVQTSSPEPASDASSSAPLLSSTFNTAASRPGQAKSFFLASQ